LVSTEYVVPLTLVVEGNNEVVTGISFKNNLHYSALSQRSSKYLYLPEEDGGVPFDTVARAVMASSAFPLVFGRVEMSYCLPITEPVGGQSAAPEKWPVAVGLLRRSATGRVNSAVCDTS